MPNISPGEIIVLLSLLALLLGGLWVVVRVIRLAGRSREAERIQQLEDRVQELEQSGRTR
ncbi:hypothetical protein [Deinococcus budaensis]|uniref:Flagellar biogenesis protein FliO n=1 Tax=Deinococcus budaensis TaxID=1665626 RepID=A0A7W8GCL2_9DEIO|nr:hypothetical protein [Deinococcus budaensis]MBB5233094.1 flagellar biogenesis protein FliO [Deinococcus budaensis]